MQSESPRQLFAAEALTSEGWQRDVLLDIADGRIASVAAGAKAPAGAVQMECLLPGMSNLHSHAFQRAMAGISEYRSSQENNFWGWREEMYRLALLLSPEQVEAIARHLYIEMLKSGYTSVAEFHYLHHAPDGSPYANPLELSERIHAAAQTTGIALSHLPVLYQQGNFGGVAAEPGQRRFLHSTEDFLKRVEALNARGMLSGVAFHSLRAVPPESIRDVLGMLPALGLTDAPIHIHAAEQIKEVRACMAWGKVRPVEWLLDNANVDARWCLVHATHMTVDETARLAKSGAVAGLCPSTEGNLGDGLFPAESYFAAGGRWGIGSDSHITLSPFDELRLLEYNQRLAYQRRAVLASGQILSTGRRLYTDAARGGAQALGLQGGVIATGMRADLIALDCTHPLLAERRGDTRLDSAIFALSAPPVREVFVAGRHVVQNGRHAQEDASTQAFRTGLREL
ncbi:MAG: formimidoylglutamate deiminase [Alphaproteobacteria bacterium]|nr:formimidoylglutamate deiminase [Alphaproteobacteria bacterium]